MAKLKGMELIVSRLQPHLDAGLPGIVTGDFNTVEGEGPYNVVTAKLRDAVMVSATKPIGPWRSAHGWRWRVGVDGLSASRVRSVAGGWFEAPTCAGIFLGSSFAASGWFQVTSHTEGQTPLLFSAKTLYTDSHGWFIALQERPDCISINGGGGENSGIATGFPNLTAFWRYMSGVFDGTSAAVYGNPDFAKATLIQDFTLHASQESADTLKLLHDTYGAYTGYVEELRIRRGHVDAEWVNAEYVAMTDHFASFGPVEILIRQGSVLIVR